MRLKNINKTIFVFLLAVFSIGLYATDVEFPITQAFCYFPFSQHLTLAKKELKLSMDINYSSVYSFNIPRTTINDMETMTSTTSVMYGLADGLTLEGHYRFGVAYGGVMDKLIMDFHKLFSMPVGGRDKYPRNTVNYTYRDKFSINSQQTWQAPVVLGVLGRIYGKNNFAVNGRVAVGLPLSQKIGLSSSKPFVTAGLILAYDNKAKKLSASWANHVSFFRTATWMEGEELRNQIVHSEFRVDYKRIFGGLLFRSSPFKLKGFDLSNPARIVYLGVKIWKYFEFSMVEEFPPMDTTTDVTFCLRIKLFGY